jgi:hypothetical protein
MPTQVHTIAIELSSSVEVILERVS